MTERSKRRGGTRPVPTETANPRPGAGSPRRRPGPLPTVLAALACFAVVFEFLAFQLDSGRDPALGKSAGSPAAATKALPPKRKLIITKVVGTPGGPSATTGAATGSSSAAPAPAPVATATS